MEPETWIESRSDQQFTLDWAPSGAADSFGGAPISSEPNFPTLTFPSDIPSPVFATESPAAGLSPTTMFGVPADYENLLAGDSLDALARMQSTYASEIMDPFAHIKKEMPSSTFPQKSFLQDANTSTSQTWFFPNSISSSQPHSSPARPSDADAEMTPIITPFPSSSWSALSSQSVPPLEGPFPVSLSANTKATAKSLKPSTKATAATKARKRVPPSDMTMAERRRKHNEVEIRRRKKMNENFEELQDLIHYERKEKDKASVLRAVIDTLKQYESKTQDLQRNYETLQKQIATRVATRPSGQTIVSPFPYVNSKVNHQEVFMNNDVPMAVANLHGKLVDANERFLQIMGYDLESLRQVPCVLLTHPDDLPNLFKHLKDLLAGAITSFTSLKRMLTREKRYVHFSNTMWVVRAQGQPMYLTGVFIPVKIDPPLTDEELQRLHAAPRPRLPCEEHNFNPAAAPSSK